MKNAFVALSMINICTDKDTLKTCVKTVAIKYVNTNMIQEVSEDEYYTSKLGEPVSCVNIICGDEYLVCGSPGEIINEIHKEEKAQLC